MPGPRSYRSFAHSHGGGPPSPTLSATTRASIDFPSRPAVLVTRADLRASVSAFEGLLSAAKGYTNVMLTMAQASAELASALETCARVKGAHESGAGLHAASALHFLMSNYQQVMADSLWKDFSIPLLSHFDTYRSTVADRQVAHEQAVAEKSKQLKDTEARNMRTGRRKERDLNSFRRALAELQAQVDSLDELKAQYYHEVIESEEEVWEFILSKVSLMVRSQLEVAERIASKGSSDPVLEPMLATIPDPFDQYGPPKQDDQIFSILPPTSLLSSSTVLPSPNLSGSGAGPSGSGSMHHQHQHHQHQQHAHQQYQHIHQQQQQQQQQYPSHLQHGGHGYGMSASGSGSTLAGESSGASNVLHGSRASPAMHGSATAPGPAHPQHFQSHHALAHAHHARSGSAGLGGDKNGTATVGSLLGLHSGGAGAGASGSGLFGDETADEDDVLLGGPGGLQHKGHPSAHPGAGGDGRRLKKALSIIDEDIHAGPAVPAPAVPSAPRRAGEGAGAKQGPAPTTVVDETSDAEVGEETEGEDISEAAAAAAARQSTPTKASGKKALHVQGSAGTTSTPVGSLSKVSGRKAAAAADVEGDGLGGATKGFDASKAKAVDDEDDDEDERVAGSANASQGGADHTVNGDDDTEEEIAAALDDSATAAERKTSKGREEITDKSTEGGRES